MGNVGRGGDRSRGGGAGAVHDHGRFRARLCRFFQQGEAGLPGELTTKPKTGLVSRYFKFKISRSDSPEARMKIAIIGGGPAGLYSAILLKKQRPEADVAVYERNRADDTFGFGVVFSDATLDNFETWDPPSYRRITQEFAYWDDIAVHFRGTVHRVGGNGFCGCSGRTLLTLLQAPARERARA